MGAGGRETEQGKEQRQTISRWALAGAAAVLALALGVALLINDRLYPRGIGLRQPIPFSHRVHVHTKQLSCLMCHTTVLRSARAGIPPLETCMLCHERVIRNYPFIRQLREQYRSQVPVVWQRVNWLPEFVYFNHSVHLNRGIDCGACHGDVSQMDRVVPARKFQMGFCIQCHRDRGASHDCFTCHR